MERRAGSPSHEGKERDEETDWKPIPRGEGERWSDGLEARPIEREEMEKRQAGCLSHRKMNVITPRDRTGRSR